jgi:hypothetical protein
MRSATRVTAALVLALAGCGNYSTEDLRFLAALPTREDLRVAVPARASAAAALTAAPDPCPAGTADVWLWAKPTSDGLNRGVHFLVSLVDAVRRQPPSERGEDLRRWGPFPDERHPGHEIQIVIVRSHPAELGGAPRHAYAFQAREGAGPFRDVLSGSFDGPSSSRGRGTLTLDFQALWELHMNDPTTPHGTMQVTYDRASDPTTIALQLTSDGFGVAQFDYGYSGYSDGRGAFDYRFRNGGDTLTVVTSYDAAGAGRARVDYTPWWSPTPVGTFRHCWSAAACLTYVDDPTSYSCGAPCSLGDIAACVPVPAPPFPAPSDAGSP